MYGQIEAAHFSVMGDKRKKSKINSQQLNWEFQETKLIWHWSKSSLIYVIP